MLELLVMQVDVLAFGPHPDDVEMAMGGSLLRLQSLGYSVGVIDLTSGEMATRGTPEERASEASKAADILGIALRRSLNLGDSRLKVTDETKLSVIEVIREYRPKLVFTNYPENNHPDHSASGVLVSEAAYLSGLLKIETSFEPHRPNCTVYYFVPRKVVPSFVIDITPFHTDKMRAVQAHQSQLYNGVSTDNKTYVSEPDFLSRIEALDRYHGALIDTNFGEAFFIKEAIKVDDPVLQFNRPFTRIT